MPDLEALPQELETALDRSNPEILAARAALDGARAKLLAAGFAPPPALHGEAEEIPTGLDLSRAGSLRLDFEREISSGGRRAAARAVAAAEVDVMQGSLYSAERRARALASRALARAADWSAIERRLSEEDSLLAATEESIRTRFSVGRARYVEVLRLRTERLRVQSERATAGAEARIARRSLEALLGLPGQERAPDVSLDGLIDARSKAPLTLPSPAPDSDALLMASGGLRGADAAIARARALRSAALAELRPRLFGFLGIQRFRGEGSFTVGPTLGGSLSLPFAAPRATGTATVAADRELEAAEFQRNATVAAIRADIVTARERYEVARGKLGAYDAALLQGAREERESALAAYRAGDLTLLELIDFERALSRAEIDRLRSHIDAADALADMLTAAVGPSVQSRSTAASQLPGGEK